MASKKSKLQNKKKAAKAKARKISKSIIETTGGVLTISVQSGEKWHKLMSKTVTMTEPMREKQIDMFYDTAEAVQDQLENGAARLRDLLGIEEPVIEMIKEKVTNQKILSTIYSKATKWAEKIPGNPLKKLLKNAPVKLKIEIEELKTKKKKSKKNKKKSIKKVKDSKKISKVKSTNSKSAIQSAASIIKKVAKPVIKEASKRIAPPKTTSSTTQKVVSKRSPVVKPNAKSVTTQKASTPKRRVSTTKKATTTRAKSTVKRTQVVNDKLTMIYGIGPKMESMLKARGIKTFRMLAGMTLKELGAIIQEGGPRYKSYRPADWRKQALLAAKGNFQELKKFVEQNIKN